MLKVDDIRQTRVYRDAQEEGRQEGRHEATLQAIRKMAGRSFSAEDIAELLSLDLEFVRKELATVRK